MSYVQKVVIGDATLYQGDCMAVLPTLGKVDAVITDPPYFGVKGDEWDNQWASADAFIEWIGGVVSQLTQRMKPNASLYLFASPQMAARVEVAIWEHLNVLGHLVWRKGAAGKRESSRANAASKESFRSYFQTTERILFAEQYNSDNYAKGESSYTLKCDELRGFVFEPIRLYLDSEREAAGVTRRQCEIVTGTQMASHWFSRTQWALPTAEHYKTLQLLFNGEHLRKDYEELRKDYEELRKDYEELRRPFNVSANDQWSDVWDFEPVQAYTGKHSCEKPQALLAHMLNVSTKPGALVLDAFNGSGATALACMSLGRRYIGIEKDPHWFDYACKRIEQAYAQGQLFAPERAKQVQEELV